MRTCLHIHAHIPVHMSGHCKHSTHGCAHVRTHVFTHVYTHVCAHVCTHVCALYTHSAHIYTHGCTPQALCTWLHACLHVHTRTPDMSAMESAGGIGSNVLPLVRPIVTARCPRNSELSCATNRHVMLSKSVRYTRARAHRDARACSHLKDGLTHDVRPAILIEVVGDDRVEHLYFVSNMEATL